MSGGLAALARKEFRALLPTWAGAATLVLLYGVYRHDLTEMAAGLAYVVGSFALGAQAIGHEYTHRTLPLLLTQPVPRGRTLLVKLAVLALFITALGAAAWLALLDDLRPSQMPATVGRVLGFVWLTSFLLAPVLTMLCRSAMAGTLFAAALPGTIGVPVGIAIGMMKFGVHNTAAIDAFQELFFWRVFYVSWALGAAGLWWLFTRLEAVEGGGPEIHLPRFRRARAVRSSPPTGAIARHHAVWRLVKKELRLQQLVVAVAAVHAVICAGVVFRHYLDPQFDPYGLIPVTFVYVALFAVLVGSLGSAQERQLGMIPSQVLLPMAASTQWAVKVAVVLGVAVVMSVAMSSAVLAVVEGNVGGGSVLKEVGWLTAIVLVFASASLYVSSLSSSSMQALMLSVPFVFGGSLLALWTADLTVRAMKRFYGISDSAGIYPDEMMMTLLVAGAGTLLILALLLRFAYLNHRSADTGFARALRQVPVIGAMVAASAALTMFVAMENW